MESIHALQTSVYAFSFAISMAAKENKPSALSLCRRRTKDLGGATVDSVPKEKTSADFPPHPFNFSWEFIVEWLDWSCQGAAGTYILFVSKWTKRLMGCSFRCMCPEYE